MSHASLLSWAGAELGRPIDVAAIVDDPSRIPIDGAAELVASARTVATNAPQSAVYAAVAAAIGEESACDAAAVAANFQIMNRVVDAVGLPVGPKGIEANADIIAALSLDQYPHGGH